MTALHDLNSALCELAMSALFIDINQEIIDVRKCQTVDSPFR